MFVHIFLIASKRKGTQYVVHICLLRVSYPECNTIVIMSFHHSRFFEFFVTSSSPSCLMLRSSKWRCQASHPCNPSLLHFASIFSLIDIFSRPSPKTFRLLGLYFTKPFPIYRIRCHHF